MLTHTDKDSDRLVAELQRDLAQTRDQLAQTVAALQRAKQAYRVLSGSLEAHVADRMRALTALYEILMIAGRAENLQNLLDEALRQAMGALNCDTGIALLFEPDPGPNVSSSAGMIVEYRGRKGQAYERAFWSPNGALQAELLELCEPLLIADISRDERFPAELRQSDAPLWLAPLRYGDHIRGVVGLMRRAGATLGEREVALLTTLTDQMGAAVQQLELREQAQQSELLAERERLGRDLHDTITQSLYGLAAMAEAGEGQLEAGESQIATHTLKRIGQTARQALREMRLFIHELRPGILEKNGLVSALQLRLDAVEGRADIQTRLVADGIEPLSPEVEHALYRIALEALNNSLRHSGAGIVSVSLRSEANAVALSVDDNGRGFDPRQVANGGMGLANMQAYAGEIGAQLQVRSAAARGTTIRVVVNGGAI